MQIFEGSLSLLANEVGAPARPAEGLNFIEYSDLEDIFDVVLSSNSKSYQLTYSDSYISESRNALKCNGLHSRLLRPISANKLQYYN